jgi:hypothetical protein
MESERNANNGSAIQLSPEAEAALREAFEGLVEAGERRSNSALREIVKNLAECLIQCRALQELGGELEQKAMIYNHVHDDMEDEEAAKHLLELVGGFSLLREDPDGVSFREVMKLESHERGEWAWSEILANISNEDS